MKKWFFAILPPHSISAEIIAFQEELKEQYGFEHALKTPPHLTIIPPFQSEFHPLEQFCKQLESERFDPFVIQLDGFEAFPPRVIFVDVARNELLNQFAKQVKAIFVSAKLVPNKGEKHAFAPHITLANRDLTNKTFKLIFPAFKPRAYQASFEVKSLYLLSFEEICINQSCHDQS